MEGRSLFPAVLLAPGSARLAGSWMGNCLESQRDLICLSPTLRLCSVSGVSSALGLVAMALPAQPVSWALKETARSTQGAGRAPFGPWFWRRSSRRWGSSAQQSADEMPAHPHGPEATSGDCNIKFILSRCFNKVGLFPCLFLSLKLARVTAGRLWRLFKQGQPLVVGVTGRFQGGPQNSNYQSCPVTHRSQLSESSITEAQRSCDVWAGLILSLALV